MSKLSNLWRFELFQNSVLFRVKNFPQKVKECKNQVRKGAFYDRLCEVENDIVKMDSFDPDQKGLIFFGLIELTEMRIV